MPILRNILGTTPIDPNEAEELIPIHITTQAELNEWEQTNIIDAQLWLSNKQPKSSEILDQNFMRKLHKKMFGKTWNWAGKFRKTDKNIGIIWHTIPVQLKHLLEDVNFQILHKTYVLDEIATRFHHRLVFIHPFINGNGRWSRLITDTFLLSHKQKPFSWGKINFKNTDDARKQYIAALKLADKRDYSLLFDFMRS